MIEKSCDLLCIGSGGAGITAAIVASEKGADVILLSRSSASYWPRRPIMPLFCWSDLEE